MFNFERMFLAVANKPYFKIKIVLIYSNELLIRHEEEHLDVS